MKKIFLVFILFIYFISAINIFAQTPSKKPKNMDRNNKIHVLNGYIDYCNETIHALWGMENEINEFYNTLTYCTNVQKSCKFYSFYNKFYLNEEFNFDVLPAKIYENTLKNSIIFEKITFQGENIQQKLNEKLTKIKSVLDILQTKRDILFEYAKK